ncbi:hypothetical protein HYX14_06705 [Candidatus Woesearchaeota archaeon]|nr:hypothetical protein [Candidatus Woesearchaeota archaeon]
MDNKSLAGFFLRVGIAIVFLYAAVSAFLNPDAWIGFIPGWFRAIIPAGIFMWVYNLYQIGLSLWLLSGKRTFEASIIAGLTLLAIVILNMSALDLVFRDVAILFGAAALAALSKEK